MKINKYEWDFLTGKELTFKKNRVDLELVLKEEKDSILITKLIPLLSNRINLKSNQTVRYQTIWIASEYCKDSRIINCNQFVKDIENIVIKFKVDWVRINKRNEKLSNDFNKDDYFKEKIDGYFVFSLVLNKENMIYFKKMLEFIYINESSLTLKKAK